MLHLALLIHDLGKGYLEDHREVGLQIAADTAQRLGLPPHDAEALKFLVHKHLIMNHLAFRRDTSDEQLVVRFAVQVGSPELLEMLYVLTAADLGAVGPDVWDGWKAEVVTDLYHRTMQHLAGEAAGIDLDEQLASAARRSAWNSTATGPIPGSPAQLAALPAGYLNATPPPQVAADLRLLHGTATRARSRSRPSYQPETGTVQFTVATTEDIVPGIFHRLTGALTSHGLEILSAQINTLADGLVLDRFWVHDPRLCGPAAASSGWTRSKQRWPRRSGAQRQAARVPPHLAWPPAGIAGRRARPDPGEHRQQHLRAATRSSTSSPTTAPGLLYAITRTLFELGLSVGRAKIGTYLDQVVDVFYVTDQPGRKIHDEARLDEIRRRLLEAIRGLDEREA